jgi:hypothetical protein
MKIICVLMIVVAVTIPLLATPGTSGEGKPADQSEEAQIKAAVEGLYVEGLKTRNFDLIRRVCIADARLMGSRDGGELRVTTLDKWSKRFDPDNPPFKTLDYVIARVDVVGTAAQVRIDFTVDSKTPVTDFLHMVKTGGDWRIVNIIDY